MTECFIYSKPSGRVVAGIEYIDDNLEAVYHSEGRIVPNGSDYRFEYTLKDHLGNARVTFADLDNNGEVEPSEILQTQHYYPFGMLMEGNQAPQQGVANAYQYNGKELNADFGLDWLDYGARWYDASIARWSAVDPLAEKYYPISPYVYVLNNPIMLIDPDGRDVIAHDEESKRNIINGLSKEDAKYVKFDKKGKLKIRKLNKAKSESGNLKALKALANSETTYHFITSDSYESADTDEPQELAGDDENGTKGVTLLPDAENDRSPNEDVYIYTSKALSEERQAENTAHEAYGHAYFYELKQQGEDVNPNHEYETTMIEINPDAESPFDRYALGRKDVNTRLVNQIEAREKEAIKNFNSRNKEKNSIMKKWIVLLILMVTSGNLIGQNLDTLRVKCIKTMTLVIPQCHMDTLFNYEEGFFKTFYWKNGDILDIQCGSMSKSVYLGDTLRFQQYQTCENKHIITIYGVEKNTGKYWGILRFKQQRVKVAYICEEKNKKLFDKILKDIELN